MEKRDLYLILGIGVIAGAYFLLGRKKPPQTTQTEKGETQGFFESPLGEIPYSPGPGVHYTPSLGLSRDIQNLLNRLNYKVTVQNIRTVMMKPSWLLTPEEKQWLHWYYTKAAQNAGEVKLAPQPEASMIKVPLRGTYML